MGVEKGVMRGGDVVGGERSVGREGGGGCGVELRL